MIDMFYAFVVDVFWVFAFLCIPLVVALLGVSSARLHSYKMEEKKDLDGGNCKFNYLKKAKRHTYRVSSFRPVSSLESYAIHRRANYSLFDSLFSDPPDWEPVRFYDPDMGHEPALPIVGLLNTKCALKKAIYDGDDKSGDLHIEISLESCNEMLTNFNLTKRYKVL